MKRARNNAECVCVRVCGQQKRVNYGWSEISRGARRGQRRHPPATCVATTSLCVGSFGGKDGGMSLVPRGMSIGAKKKVSLETREEKTSVESSCVCVGGWTPTPPTRGTIVYCKNSARMFFFAHSLVSSVFCVSALSAQTLSHTQTGIYAHTSLIIHFFGSAFFCPSFFRFSVTLAFHSPSKLLNRYAVRVRVPHVAWLGVPHGKQGGKRMSVQRGVERVCVCVCVCRRLDAPMCSVHVWMVHKCLKRNKKITGRIKKIRSCSFFFVVPSPPGCTHTPCVRKGSRERGGESRGWGGGGGPATVHLE